MLLSVHVRTFLCCPSRNPSNCSFKRGEVSRRNEEKVPRSIMVEGKRKLRKEVLWSNPFPISSMFKIAKVSH